MDEIETLSITIDHSKPLELKSFTSSMLCIESQYRRYLTNEGIKDDAYNLYIHEVKQGSIVIDFVKGKAYKLLEHYVLEKFIETFREKIEEIVEQKIEKETGHSLRELKEFAAIAEVISQDYKSKMSMKVHIGDKITQNFHMDGIKANAVKNECLRLIDHVNEPSGELKRNVVLHWKQAGEDSKSLSIDKGIIEEVDEKRKVKLICSEELKEEMVSENERNPFNMFYIVDAEVKRIAGKPVAYIIKNIHDKGIIDDE